MGWAEIKIQQYNQGEKANWLERRVLEHANPVHLGLRVLGSIKKIIFINMSFPMISQ